MDSGWHRFLCVSTPLRAWLSYSLSVSTEPWSSMARAGQVVYSAHSPTSRGPRRPSSARRRRGRASPRLSSRGAMAWKSAGRHAGEGVLVGGIVGAGAPESRARGSRTSRMAGQHARPRTSHRRSPTRQHSSRERPRALRLRRARVSASSREATLLLLCDPACASGLVRDLRLRSRTRTAGRAASVRVRLGRGRASCVSSRMRRTRTRSYSDASDTEPPVR